jgi:hypothetical protein
VRIWRILGKRPVHPLNHTIIFGESSSRKRNPIHVFLFFTRSSNVPIIYFHVNHGLRNFYFSPKFVISTPSALAIQRMLLHLISTNPRLPVLLPSINSSVSRRRTFMYESMLSNFPLYSVWPHFRRMMSSEPTLACRNGRGFKGWKLMMGSAFALWAKVQRADSARFCRYFVFQ